MMCQFSRIGLWCLVVGVVSAQTVLGQVQQPVVMRVERVARANPIAAQASSFYNAEIRGVGNGPDDVLLEHPSNPKSMLRRFPGAGYAIVQAAQKSGDIPTQHLFDDTVTGVKKSVDAVANEVVPPPPGVDFEASVETIEPIVTDDPEPTPASPTANSKSQATEVIASESAYTNPWPIEVQAASDQVGPIEVEAFSSQEATIQGSAPQGSVIQKSAPVAHGCS